MILSYRWDVLIIRVPYYMWDGIKGEFPYLSYIFFEKSGHWVFLEEQELFYKKLIEWVESN